MQTLIVALVVFLSVLYALKRLRAFFRNDSDPCAGCHCRQGCQGCSKATFTKATP